MDSQHTAWTKKFQGNHRITNSKYPMIHYVENDLKEVPLADYPDRPIQAVDLLIGDPTKSPQFKTNPTNLQILKNNVGKIDGETNTIGDEGAREKLAQIFQSPAYSITKQNVILTTGGSLSIWSSIMLLANEGDNFLYPTPGFPLAGTIGNSIGLIPRYYHLKPAEGWNADIQEMETLVDERTKFIYINDPSNPLGACWSESHKRQIIQFAKKKNLPIIADQIYEGVIYDEPVKTFAELSTEEVTIFKCSALTKKWLGPGWRLGWIILYANEQNLNKYKEPLKKISYITQMPNTIMQASLKQILENPTTDAYLNERIKIMAKNKDILEKALKNQTYCTLGSASGAFYLTVILIMDQFEENKFASIKEFCISLYAEQNVLVLPGIFFQSSQNFFRLVISCSNSKIQQFSVRFKRFCQKYLKKN